MYIGNDKQGALAHTRIQLRHAKCFVLYPLSLLPPTLGAHSCGWKLTSFRTISSEEISRKKRTFRFETWGAGSASWRVFRMCPRHFVHKRTEYRVYPVPIFRRPLKPSLILLSINIFRVSLASPTLHCCLAEAFDKKPLIIFEK